MKKELQDRLKLYALAAGAVTATASKSDAQIVYVDLNPDDTVSAALTGSDSLFLDLDSDGNVDFNFLAVSFGYSYSGTYGSYAYNVAGQGAFGASNSFGTNQILQSNFYAAALNSGSNIGSSGSWSSSGTMAVKFSYFYAYSGYSYSYSSSYGNWQNQSNKYLGLKFQIGSNVHYGWARISFVDFNEFIIHDYAYNATPNAPISAGDIGIVNYADAAENVVATDVGSNANGQDLQVSFNAADETTVSLYRAIVVKDAVASSFGLLDAISTPANEGYNINPTGSSSYTVTLNATSLDSDGDLITDGVPYRVFIHSVNDGTVANYDTISAPSNIVTLDLVIQADAPQNVVITDVADNSNGLDMQVSFQKIADESTISEYRVFVLKSAQANSFNLALAQANSNFKTVAPTGQNQILLLDAGSKDIDGDLITIDTPYKAFAMAVADGTNATMDNLSQESNEIELLDITGIADINDTKDLTVQYGTDQIYISDQKGRMLESATLMNASGSIIEVYSETNQITIKRSNLPHGVYLVHLNMEGNSIMLKLIN